MNSLLNSLALLAILLSATHSTVMAQPVKTVTSPSLKAVDAIIQNDIKAKHYPGAVLIIGQPGKTLWAKAYGNHTYDLNSKSVTLNTIFDLASVTKVVGTATAAMKLIEERKLSLNDKVSTHLPEFGERRQGIGYREGPDDACLRFEIL